MNKINHLLIFSLISLALGFMPAQANAAPARDKPQRIVSVGLCADAWVSELAEPNRIVGVTRGARDETISAYVKESKDIPVHDGSAESVYALKPDLVIADMYTRPSTLAVLQRLGVKTVIAPAPRKLNEWRQPLEIIAEALGERQKGAVLTKKLAKTESEIRKYDDLHLLAAIYRPGGYSPGGSALAGDVLRAVGLRNVNDLLGRSETEILSKEALLYADPDYLINDLSAEGRNMAELELSHPAIRRFTEMKKRINLPLKYWFCLSPKTFPAVVNLRKRLEKPRYFVKK